MTGLLALLVLVSSPELVDRPAASPVQEEDPASPRFPPFGVVVDAGIPDGIGASAIWRPVRLIGLSAGGVTTGVSAGVRVGVLVMPLGGLLRPTLGAEVGRMFEGQIPWVLNVAGADRYTGLARRIEYDFANLHVGLEVGTRRVAVFARAGLSQINGRLREIDELSVETGGAVSASGVNLRLRGPSVKLGLVWNLG